MKENNDVIEFMKQMNSNHEKAYARTEEHLSHLRTNVHNLVNELGGVTQLTRILHDDLKNVKSDHKDSIHLLSEKIGNENTHLEERLLDQLKKAENRIKEVESTVEEIKPKAESFGKLSDNVAKVLVTVLAGVVMSALALLWNWKDK